MDEASDVPDVDAEVFGEGGDVHEIRLQAQSPITLAPVRRDPQRHVPVPVATSGTS